MSRSAERPLSGRRVLVTRAQVQSDDLCAQIEALGGIAYEFPTIRIKDPLSYRELDEAIHRLSEFQWIVFTSRNGVDRFFRRLHAISQAGVRKLSRARFAATGPRTAEALERRGCNVDVLPGEYRAEALLSALAEKVECGDKVLLPRADIARDVLPEGLRELGCRVTDVDAYRTELETGQSLDIVRLLSGEVIDIVTFTSSSTARNFTKILDTSGRPWRKWMKRVKIACIGPLTANTVRECGFTPHVVADDYTVEGLIAALEALSSPARPSSQ